jgi:acyl-CoA thioesterase
MSGEPTPVLNVRALDETRWTAPHPDEDPEQRDVVFSGQLLGQMIMVSSAATAGEKEVKSIHAVFARAGTYSGGPVQYERDGMHAGRAWASDTVTAYQGDRLLTRALVLLNTVERDLMRHTVAMPDVPGPEACAPQDVLVVCPGSEVRPVELADSRSPGGAPRSHYWVRLPSEIESVAARQAGVAWCQPGFTIGTAMQPHRDTVNLRDAHRTISTGVISHTSHFHDHAPVGAWLLVSTTASFAGNGRVFGSGTVFGQDGTLVSTFGQDAMVRHAEGPIDARRGM